MIILWHAMPGTVSALASTIFPYFLTRNQTKTQIRIFFLQKMKNNINLPSKG